MLNVELGMSINGNFDFSRLSVPEILTMNHRLNKLNEERRNAR